MRDYYMLRMLNHERDFSRKLFDDNYILIGYQYFDQLENWDYIQVYKNAENKNALLKEMIEKTSWQCNNRQIASHRKLNKFFEMKIGDIVIIPDYKTFHIVEIASDIKSFHSIHSNYVSEGEEYPDIGFLYKVKKIVNDAGESSVAREKFADSSLIARLKNISGFLNLNDLKDSIENSKQAFLENKVVKIDEVLKETLKKALIEKLIEKLSPNKFETLILKIMEKLGASKCDIPNRNDKTKAKEGHGDVDIVAVFEKIKHIIYIQAKFHVGHSNDWAIKQLDDYNGEKDIDSDYSTSYWAITTAEFNDDAIEIAKKISEEKTIRLIGKYDLAELILEIGVEGIE